MSQFRFSEQKVISLRHKITDDIRKAIFEGKLKPGDRIREMELSKQMGTSRAPIREAILMLEQEGLLVSQPYKETVVAEFSKRDVIDLLLPIRLTIELFSIRAGLPKITSEEIDRLSEIVEDMKEGAIRGNLIKVVDSDLAFHEYLVNLSKYAELNNIWASIFNLIRLHFFLQTQVYKNLDELCAKHDKILQAIKTQDMENVCALLTRHIYDENLEQLISSIE